MCPRSVLYDSRPQVISFLIGFKGTGYRCPRADRVRLEGGHVSVEVVERLRGELGGPITHALDLAAPFLGNAPDAAPKPRWPVSRLPPLSNTLLGRRLQHANGGRPRSAKTRRARQKGGRGKAQALTAGFGEQAGGLCGWPTAILPYLGPEGIRDYRIGKKDPRGGLRAYEILLGRSLPALAALS
ncbi:hypothetical protein GGTG_11598 [Gaeumannomyces tritici R3-111a-1]|uniref:Uncharacterized protein n=1 Tax=Gaeumannomyces tritici (strain R3-111a-1) TaxID=644352 RepID=J3PDM5_GAET3|nr:hypothetical protein GGTG_11598 [Gaeumannomyces tritici R3-111a-1]EJT70575.1 hypothetical protein GGTG_11598 [Gaeumannomyces tritici R3-111a-1]